MRSPTGALRCIPILGLFTALAGACGGGGERRGPSTPTPAPAQRASLVVVNAHVWTGDAANPWAEAVAVAGERIVAVGANAAVRGLSGPEAKVIDAHGGMVHAQHIAPPDIPRFAALEGVVPPAAANPSPLRDELHVRGEALGELRLQRGVNSLERRGGGDGPVAPERHRRSGVEQRPPRVRPLRALRPRATLDGKRPGGWVPEQKITLDEALRAYTSAAAHAGFQGAVGVLRAGMLADLVVLDKDLAALAPAAIRSAHVTTTIVGGRVVHETRL